MSHVRIPALFVPLAVVAGCHQLFGLQEVEGEELCGDGVLLVVEECDDGSDIAGDGCGTTCLIEPGFECLTMNQPCLPVVGLSRGPVGTQLEAAGEDTGNPFAFACPASEVVIGFEGYANGAVDNVGSLRAVCGSLAVTSTGDVLWTRSSQSEFVGSEQSGSLLSAICAQDEVGTGFLPNINTYLSGFQWGCRQVAHTGGALQFGASRSLTFGPSKGTDQTNRSCPQGEVVSATYGKSGSSVDLMGLRCSRISTVVCGDGELAPPEMCDDGNLTQGDGCGRRCQLE